MRPILSATGTYNFELAKWLDTLLKPLACNEFMVSDTFTFVQELSSMTVRPTDVFVSYDVTSLFTSVPLEETINYLVQKAFKNDWLFRNHQLTLTADNLTKLLHAATRDQLFVHNGNLYEQYEGVAMGSPLGPLMANAFMCMLEDRIVTSGKLPGYYRRYIDDTIAIFPDHKSHEDFFTYLNTLHPSIRFTAEKADHGVLPFIGVNCIQVASKLETAVYHKPTDTGLLLHYHSHVDQRYKKALLKTMLTRTYRICSSWTHFHTECGRIHTIFSTLQYPTFLISRTIKEVINSLTRPATPSTPLASSTVSRSTQSPLSSTPTPGSTPAPTSNPAHVPNTVPVPSVSTTVNRLVLPYLASSTESRSTQSPLSSAPTPGSTPAPTSNPAHVSNTVPVPSVSTTVNRLVLPYKSLELSRSLRSELDNISKRLDIIIKPVFTSRKVKDLISLKETTEEDDIISRSKVVYIYRCSCEASYIGYTSRHLHQRIAEHCRDSSSIQQHCKTNGHPFNEENFTVISKCNSKFDCMLRESHEIYFKRPNLNARDEYSCSLVYGLRL